MSRSDAYVTVECDHPDCYEKIQIELTSLAGRGQWDERGVEADLRHNGWTKDADGGDICPEHDDEEDA